MSERMVDVCVVGAGRAGMVHARNFRWNIPEARLVGIVETDQGRAAEMVAELDLDSQAAMATLDEAFERLDPDAVVITTPTFTHADLVIAAAGARRHVLCEKPLAISLGECDRIEAAVSDAGVVFEMGFMRHFDPPFVEAERLLRAGKVGSPVMMRSLTRGPGLPPPWANDPETSNGMLAEVNSHDFDSVRWLMDSEVRSVFARAAALKVPELRQRYPGFYDTAAVILEMESGAIAIVEGICPVTYGYDARAEIVGSEGALVVGSLEGVAITSVRPDEGTVQPMFRSWRDRFRQAYLDEARYFVRRIVDGAAETSGPLAGRRALEAVLAANESIRTREPVEIPR